MPYLLRLVEGGVAGEGMMRGDVMGGGVGIGSVVGDGVIEGGMVEEVWWELVQWENKAFIPPRFEYFIYNKTGCEEIFQSFQATFRMIFEFFVG